MGLADEACRARRNRINMVRKGGTVERGKHVVAEGKILGQGEIVRYIRLRHLGITVESPVLSTSPIEIEMIHAAVVHHGKQAGPVMANVIRHGIVCLAKRHHLTRRGESRGRSVGTRKGSEIFIKRPVFLDYEDDMLDVRQ